MSNKMDDNSTPRRVIRIGIAALFGFAIAVAASLYAFKQSAGNGGAATNISDQPAGEQPFGGIGTFVLKPTPAALPNAAFQTADGAPVTLDAWRGKVVLLNLWATWCIPCRKEMPALDRLQSQLGSPDFEVVALSIDRSGVAGTRKFLDSVAIKNLKLYADPSAKLANEFKAIGLPTTLLIDRQGREIGRLIGPAEWDSPDAVALIQKALAAK